MGKATSEADELAALAGFHFMVHSKALVLALRNQGLVWGITFPNVDIHHFEMREPPLPKPGTPSPGPKSP